MLICNECNEIYDSDFIAKDWYGRTKDQCPKKHCLGELVDIDENMIPICKSLWNKGYTTHFTCEGHHDALGSLPYIVFSFNGEAFDIPFTESINRDDEFLEEYTPLICVTNHYIETSDVNGYTIDINEARKGNFKNEYKKTLWETHKDSIEKIESLPLYKNLSNDVINQVDIVLTDYGFVKLSIHFKCVLNVLTDMHPDLDCEVSDLKNLHTESKLFKIYIDHKAKYLKFLMDYVDDLPDLNKIKEPN